MRKIISSFIIVIFIVTLLGSCATTSETGKKTAIGGAIGCGVGAVGGLLTTGKIEGALKGCVIGGAAGALAGYIIGKHEEQKYKSTKQIYIENPKFAEKGSKLPPTVVKLNPYVANLKGNKITAVKTEQPIKLCMKYDIAAGTANTQKTVNKEDVDLVNYLVMADGRETPHSKRSPSNDLSVEGNIDCTTIEKGLPKGIPDGNYTHVAIVKLGGKETMKKETILVAKSNGEIKIYALNNSD